MLFGADIYKAMAGPNDLNFGLYLLSTMNVYYQK